MYVISKGHDHEAIYYLSRVMIKPTFCTCENKDADELRGNSEADQRLCFRYIDSTIPLLSKSEISSLWPSSVVVQPGLCRTRSETRTLVFSYRGSFCQRDRDFKCLTGQLRQQVSDTSLSGIIA